MQEPRIPVNEASRIETLKSLSILDTPSEDRFDRYTRISARIFDTPIALISLVDRYRQWFKAAEGFKGSEAPRDISFCGHAILGDDIFEVRNARRDPRFRDNPLVINSPHVCFYAGAPLTAPNGHKLGTLCIIDRVPRRLSNEDRKMLKSLANMVVGEMINYVDAESGLANRSALLVAGTDCIAKYPTKDSFSLLIFDICNFVDMHNDERFATESLEKVAKLLCEYFPNAKLIASIGKFRFCVLLLRNTRFDVDKAANRLCANAATELIGEGDRIRFSALVGRLYYDPARYDSILGMLLAIDEASFCWQKMPQEAATGKYRFLKSVLSLRKTTF